jgi:hypothetical protein
VFSVRIAAGFKFQVPSPKQIQNAKFQTPNRFNVSRGIYQTNPKTHAPDKFIEFLASVNPERGNSSEFGF